MPAYTARTPAGRFRAIFPRALTIAEQEAIADEIAAALRGVRDPEHADRAVIATLERWRARAEGEAARG